MVTDRRKKYRENNMAGVILDAGHGGYDNGAQYDGRKEKDDNLRLTLAVGQILEQNGVPVSYTRQSDIYQFLFITFEFVQKHHSSHYLC